MSNSATNLDLISVSQAQKEVTANALFDAASPAILYGRRASTTGGLVWGYYGGCVFAAGAVIVIANGTLNLTASATNYIQADSATGAITVNTTGFTAGKVPLYQVVAGTASVTSYTDNRAFTLGGAADAALAAHIAATDPHPQYLTQSEGGALYDALGAAASAVSAHVAASDPHTQYLTQTRGDARYLQTVPAQPYDLTAFYPGTAAASVLVSRIPFARAVAFPAGLTGSVAKAKTAATAQTDFDVQKNGVSVGTIRFAASASSASFIAASAFSLAAGDVLSIIAPAVADTTLADIGFVLTGTR